jgi:hypothetical protein
MAWSIVEDFDPVTDYCDAYVVDVDLSREDLGPEVQKILRLTHSQELQHLVYSHKFFENDVFLTPGFNLGCKRLAFATLRNVPWDKKTTQTTFTDAYRATYYHLLGLIYSLDHSLRTIAIHPLYGSYAVGPIKLWFDAMAMDVCAFYEKENEDHTNVIFCLEDFASVYAASSFMNNPLALKGKGEIRKLKDQSLVLTRKSFPYALPPKGSYNPKREGDRWVNRLKLNERGLSEKSKHPLISTYFAKPYIPGLSFYGDYVAKYRSLMGPAEAKLMKERTNLFLGEKDTVKGSKAFYSYETGLNGVSKSILFLTAVALDMSYEDTMDFFLFSSFALSEHNLADRFMKDTLKKHLYFASPVYLEAAFAKATGGSLYAKRKKGAAI